MSATTCQFHSSHESLLKAFHFIVQVFDVKPGSQRFLTEGTRVCAYWSQQFSCLYPGTIIKGSPTPEEDTEMILVEFDDGDSGRIVLEHIRMLPPDYPIISKSCISV